MRCKMFLNSVVVQYSDSSVAQGYAQREKSKSNIFMQMIIWYKV